MSKYTAEDLMALLSPGDPNEISEEQLHAWKQDEMRQDDARDGHRQDVENELLAKLEEDNQFRAEAVARLRKSQSRVKLTSALRKQIFLVLRSNPNVPALEVLREVDDNWEDDFPYGKPFSIVYEKNRRIRATLDSTVSQIRTLVRSEI